MVARALLTWNPGLWLKVGAVADPGREKSSHGPPPASGPHSTGGSSISWGLVARVTMLLAPGGPWSRVLSSLGTPGWGSNVADPEPAVQALACEVAAPNIREGARTEVAGVLARLLTRVVSV